MVILAFFVLIASWFACGFYCSQVAYSKGYNGTAWAFGGFLFGFIALIAVAGLPDRKLRKYIRQIGEKQNAIDPEGFSDFKKVIDDKPLTPEERKELIKKVGKKPS